MDCREFRSKHVAYVDDLLAAVDMDAMRAHLGLCAGCARQDTSVRRSLLLVHNLPSIEPSADFMKRLNSRLAELGPPPRVTVTRTSLFFSAPAMGTFAAVAAGIGIVAVLSFHTARNTLPTQVARAPIENASAGNARITNAPLPDFDLMPASASPMANEPEMESIANAAYVAAVPTGISIWPAVLMVGETQGRFVNLELQQPEGR
jgi:Putative zinc-finger